MRPDRIVVGEVRGGECLDMLQAMNTGHDGSISTVHANSPRDAIARLETLVLMAGMDIPLRAVREQVASAVNLIVHISRLRDGTRRVTHITEVQGMEGDIVTLQDAFVFDYSAGVDANGRFLGKPIPTGVRPRFTDRFVELGIQISPARVRGPMPAVQQGAVAMCRKPRRRSSLLGCSWSTSPLVLFGWVAFKSPMPASRFPGGGRMSSSTRRPDPADGSGRRGPEQAASRSGATASSAGAVGAGGLRRNRATTCSWRGAITLVAGVIGILPRRTLHRHLLLRLSPRCCFTVAPEFAGCSGGGVSSMIRCRTRSRCSLAVFAPATACSGRRCGGTGKPAANVRRAQPDRQRNPDRAGPWRILADVARRTQSEDFTGSPRPSKSTGKWVATWPKSWTMWVKQSGTETRFAARYGP